MRFCGNGCSDKKKGNGMQLYKMTKAACILAGLCLMLDAEVPKFEFTGVINIGGEENIDWFPSPCIADWDEDGKNDVLVGEFKGGAGVRLCINTGTSTIPAFASSTYLEAGGSTIQLSAT